MKIDADAHSAHLDVLIHAAQHVVPLRMRLDVAHGPVSIAHLLPHEGLHGASVSSGPRALRCGECQPPCWLMRCCLYALNIFISIHIHIYQYTYIYI